MLGVAGACCAGRGDPEAKGLVERANGYLETSFLPGRTFTSPADFNAQLAGWLRAGEQPPAPAHRGAARPTGRPPTGPRCWRCRRSPPAVGLAQPRPGCRATTTCGSTPTTTRSHPRAIGRRVEVVADLEQVTVTCAGAVGRPPRRGAGPGTRPSPTPPTPQAGRRDCAARRQRQRPPPAAADVEVDRRRRPEPTTTRLFGIASDEVA